MLGELYRNTGGAIFSTGEAHAPPVKQLKMPWYWPCVTDFSGLSIYVLTAQGARKADEQPRTFLVAMAHSTLPLPGGAGAQAAISFGLRSFRLWLA